MTEDRLKNIENNARRILAETAQGDVAGPYASGFREGAKRLAPAVELLVAEVRRLRAQRDAWVEFADALHKGDDVRLAAAGAAIARTTQTSGETSGEKASST